MQHYASPIFMAFAISLFFNAVVANGKSTTTPKTTTDENDNNRGVIIIDDELVGCCESFGYGEYMVKCCFDYQDNVKQSACLRHKLGGGQRHYANKQCSAVKQEKEEISEPLTRKISTTTTTTTSFQAYVSDSTSTATMDENDKNRGASTIDDELVGCCESFGYGSFMVKCCFDYQDNVKQSACLRHKLGGGQRHYANKQCSAVKQEKEEISEPLTRKISTATTKTTSFQAYVSYSISTATMDENDKNRAVSITDDEPSVSAVPIKATLAMHDRDSNRGGTDTDDDELVGCCEYFGYGSFMVKCCFSYQDNVKQSACVSECCGGGRRHHANKQCSTVKQEKAVSASSSLLPAMTLFIFCFMPYFV